MRTGNLVVLSFVIVVGLLCPASVLGQSNMLQSGTESTILQTSTESTMLQTQTEQPPPSQMQQYQMQYQESQQQYQPQLSQPNPNALQIGTTWNEEALGEMEGSWKWFVIPEWLAGKWHREKSKAQLFGFLPLIIKAERNRVYGYQTDEQGRIWHLVRTPYKARVERDGYFDMFVVRDEELKATGDNSVIMKTTWTRYVVKNNRIKDVINGSQIDTIQSVGDGIITTKSNLKFGNATWTDQRVQEYSPIEFYKNIHLPTALHQFRQGL